MLKQGLRVQKDENGVEGVVTEKEGCSDEKEIKIGQRLSASKVKQQDWGDAPSKLALNQEHERHSKNLTVACNTKAGSCSVETQMTL